MSKHTPGPWVVTDFCTLNTADVDVRTSHDIHTSKAICECHFNTAAELRRGEDGCHQLEAEANARLIAAAPEMLEALRRSLSWLSSYPGEGAMGCYDQARAAIAKATGEPS